MTTDPIELLVQEVEDLLRAGPVGLYEFLWILNSEQIEGSKDQHLRIARQALDRLLKDDESRLIALLWAQPDSERDLDREVRDDDFDDPDDDPYVAIIRE